MAVAVPINAVDRERDPKHRHCVSRWWIALPLAAVAIPIICWVRSESRSSAPLQTLHSGLTGDMQVLSAALKAVPFDDVPLPECTSYSPIVCPGPHRCSPMAGEEKSAAHCDACQCCPNGNACANSPDHCLHQCPNKKRDYEAPLCPGMANWSVNPESTPPLSLSSPVTIAKSEAEPAPWFWPELGDSPLGNTDDGPKPKWKLKPPTHRNDQAAAASATTDAAAGTNGQAGSDDTSQSKENDSMACPNPLGPCDVPFTESDREYGRQIGKPPEEWTCGCGINGCEQMTPKFNWVIGTCRRGVGQACTWMPDGTGAQSEVILNYIATYQYRVVETPDSSHNSGEADDQRLPAGEFVLVTDSSKNTDGECGNATDLIRDHTSWLQAQPGSSGGWEQGYYPSHVPGVGPPAMMFVISAEVFKYATLYLLNQATLNRGPATLNPLCFAPGTTALNNSNCWGDGSSGEIDLLEPPFWDEAAKNDTSIYERLYATSFNSAGRCFPAQNLPTGGSGGQQTNAYFLGDDEPHIYASVIDRSGITIYRDPKLWLTPDGEAGLTRKHAARRLQPRPVDAPDCNQPPCDACATSKTCALFMPACPTERGGHCHVEYPSPDRTRDQSCTLNWWDLFVDTAQHTVGHAIQWLYQKHDTPPPCTCRAADRDADDNAAADADADADTSALVNGDGANDRERERDADSGVGDRNRRLY